MADMADTGSERTQSTPGAAWQILRQALAPPSMRFAGFGAVGLPLLVPTCAAVVLLATTFFFVLHHLGNQLPHDLAAQRFQVEHASDRPDEGHAKGYKGWYEYCEMSGTVMAGARRTGERSSVRDAVILKGLKGWEEEEVAYCIALQAATTGAFLPEEDIKTRYWWGGKALYAIALRYASVHQIREFTQAATRVAYLLLAASLLLLSPKMLVLGAPLVVFGAFFSGIEYWADVANGFPYLWTVLFAAGLALLVRRDVGRRELDAGRKMRKARETRGRVAWSAAAPVCCFAAGTVSSYLWMGDGHTFLVVTWIGMIVWFGSGSLDVAEKTGRTVWCIVLYGAGIVACYVLGQIVKAVFLGDAVWVTFLEGLLVAAERTWSPSELAAEWMGRRRDVGLSAYIDSFYMMAWPDWLPADVFPTSVAFFSLAASLAIAAFEARRGRPELAHGVLWIVGLIAISSLTFVIVEHEHYRTARFVFAPLALCLSCLVLAVWTMDWRRSLATIWEIPVLLVVVVPISWYVVRYELNATVKMIESIEGLRPVVRAPFDVYLDEDRLVYVKEECPEGSDEAPFFLHLYPVNVADLSLNRQQYRFDNLDFTFREIGRRDAERCAAVVFLPDYEVYRIETGQAVLGKEVWREKVSFKDFEPSASAKMLESVEDLQHMAGAAFDVYLDGDRLIYVKEDCRGDDEAPFFLHLYPVDVADLPLHRQGQEFDNLDFTFREIGHRDAGGRCVAERVLPGYEVALIDTGQGHPEGNGWHKKFRLGSL